MAGVTGRGVDGDLADSPCGYLNARRKHDEAMVAFDPRDNALACIARFKQAGVRLETEETADGHEWKNWRPYLSQVAPILFR